MLVVFQRTTRRHMPEEQSCKNLTSYKLVLLHSTYNSIPRKRRPNFLETEECQTVRKPFICKWLFPELQPMVTMIELMLPIITRYTTPGYTVNIACHFTELPLFTRISPQASAEYVVQRKVKLSLQHVMESHRVVRYRGFHIF
jgi:hypothetical protein